MIKVLADQNLYKLEKFLPKEIDLTIYDSHSQIPEVDGFDALLVRTVSKINAGTFPSLPGSLKFVGTGSSGNDHVDIDYLTSHAIKFANALGCNAQAVAEYVITALLLWREEKQKNLNEFKYGIIGVGKAGASVANILQTFGLDTILYDPPRAACEPDFFSAGLEEVLNCDVLSFHIPFTCSGNHFTNHWLNEEKLKGRRFELIINAARGGVIDEIAVSSKIESGAIKDVIIDVWQNEPDFDVHFAEKTFLATPHIAGYSEQSKLNASKLVCEKLCSFFELECPATKDLYPIKQLQLPDLSYSFEDLLNRMHPIKEYDAALRDLVKRDMRSHLFSKLRTDLPFRYEYAFLKLKQEFLDEFEDLKNLGVQKS